MILQQPLPIPPDMPIKSAKEVLTKYKKFFTKDFVGRVAIKLAQNTYYFGAAGSTITECACKNTRSKPTGYHEIRTSSRTLRPLSLKLSGRNASTPLLGLATVQEIEFLHTPYSYDINFVSLP
jgi:hypothetical protein